MSSRTLSKKHTALVVLTAGLLAVNSVGAEPIPPDLSVALTRR